MSYNPSQGIGTGDRSTPAHSNRALAIKVFSGEVLTSFETSNIFLPLVQTRTIASGKSASFAVIGQYDTATSTHTPGTDITPNLINAGERVIEIDSLKYASVFVDNFEEAMQHYETRSQYSTEMGRRLSKTVDTAIISQLDLCVANAANTNDTNGGEGQPYSDVTAFSSSTAYAIGARVSYNSVVYVFTATHSAGAWNAAHVDAISVLSVATSGASTAGAKGDLILASMFDAQTTMDEEDIPGDRYVVVSPKNYNRLVQSGAVHKDMTQGSNGGIDTGKIVQVAGHNILVSNNIASSDIYMFTQNAVGVVKLLDIKSEVNYIPEKLGDLMTSSYAMGFGTLNNACVIKMTTTD
jgi:hypothetical protein